MREVETVQPLASPPVFGGTIYGTPPSTGGSGHLFPPRPQSRVPPGLRLRGHSFGQQLAETHDFLSDRGDTRLGGRNDPLTVLMRLFVGDDDPDVVGRGEILDGGYRVADVELVVVADG